MVATAETNIDQDHVENTLMMTPPNKVSSGSARHGLV